MHGKQHRSFVTPIANCRLRRHLLVCHLQIFHEKQSVYNFKEMCNGIAVYINECYNDSHLNAYKTTSIVCHANCKLSFAQTVLYGTYACKHFKCEEHIYGLENLSMDGCFHDSHACKKRHRSFATKVRSKRKMPVEKALFKRHAHIKVSSCMAFVHRIFMADPNVYNSCI